MEKYIRKMLLLMYDIICIFEKFFLKEDVNMIIFRRDGFLFMLFVLLLLWCFCKMCCVRILLVWIIVIIICILVFCEIESVLNIGYKL